MWIVGEDMPQESNRVTLNTAVKDQWGLPVPNVHFDDHPNDVAMRDHGYAAADAALRGGRRDRRAPHAAVPVDAQPRHLPDERAAGGRRRRPRGARRTTCPNLFVSDGSVITTGAAANPTLTIVALAIRQAEHIVSELAAGRL